ncbi:2-phospho-L-lactate guanylyltransferase [Nocardioides marmoraquaticus]
MSFCLLVPVKRLDRAKSRLGGDPADRGALALAFARDAIAAARGCSAVARLYVVTDGPGDPGARESTWDGAELLPDAGDGDLNAALRHAERTVRLQHPDLGVAAMCADLPSLVTTDLDSALDPTLAGALGRRWFVQDADGTGTTLLAAAAGTDLDPRFGAGSSARHEASGARPLRAEVPTLRRDVDTTDALAEAVRLGVGPRTRAALMHQPVTD